MKILFLTRVHPPIIGGLENQSYNLIKNFKKLNKDTYKIANTYGKKNLPFFLPYSFLKSIYLIKKHNITHLHLSDAVLAPLGTLIKKITGVKTFITIHALDIKYENSLYQKIIPSSVNKLDGIICVSENTKRECIKRKISKEKISIIPNGINTKEFILPKSKSNIKKKLEKKFNIKLKDKKILLLHGRQVRRKGTRWFVENIMPSLGNEYVCIISGAGPENEEIKKTIEKKKLEKKVFMLNKTSNEDLKLLYNSSDLFIMPNITISGDAEGFGIVIIEAGSCGLPTITSGIEGTKDAVINGKTGWIVGEKNKKEFIQKIKNSKFKKREIQKEVEKHFDWKKIAEKYSRVMK